MGVLAFIFAIIFVIVEVTSGKGSVSNVVGFMMAAGNTYGLILIIILMGSGLVNVPRRLWYLPLHSNHILCTFLEAEFHAIVN